MSREYELQTPLRSKDVNPLRIGDVAYLSGIIFTMRDMAHLRLMKKLNSGEKPIENFEGSVIFHAGPVVDEQIGKWIISVIGPTTSIRMESYSEMIFGKLGVKVLVGKGGMGENTQKALAQHGGVYMLAPPGCAVVQAKSMLEVLRVHWLELGVPEALWVIRVNRWGPLVVGMDSKGNSMFQEIKERATVRINKIFGER